MRTRWTIAILLATAIAVPFIPGCGDAHQAGQVSTDESGLCAAEPKTADLDLTLKDMHGADVNLAELKGRPLLINFWATWCGPCVQEIPYLVEIADTYRDEGLVVLGISTDDTAEQIKPYASDLKVNYPMLVGLDQPDVERAFGAMWAIPVTMFVKKDGTVCKTHQGTQTKEFFDEHVRALL